VHLIFPVLVTSIWIMGISICRWYIVAVEWKPHNFNIVVWQEWKLYRHIETFRDYTTVEYCSSTVHPILHAQCRVARKMGYFAWNIVFIMVSSPSTPLFLCPRHSKNGGGTLSVTPVRACVRASVLASVCPLSKFGVNNFWKTASIHSNLVCWYIIPKHMSSLIWGTIN